MAEKPEALIIQYNPLRMSHTAWPPDDMTEKFERLQKELYQSIYKEQNE